MVRFSSPLVALALLAGAVTQGNGESLRSLINQRMATQQRTRVAVDKKNCIPEDTNPSSTDRTCEPPPPGSFQEVASASGNARCDWCRQQCHIFGDPHVKPFTSGCTTDSLARPGWYLYLDIPDLRIETRVDKSAPYKWFLHEAWVNGKKAMDIEDFKAGGRGAEKRCEKDPGIEMTFDLYSDHQRKSATGNLKKNAKPDVQAKVFINCRPRGGNLQLELLVTMEEAGKLETSPYTSQRSDSSSNGIDYFAAAQGACVDWIKYGNYEYASDTRETIEDNLPTDTTASQLENSKFNCKRRSKLATTDGRECSCGAECAVWGDPHIVDFHRPMSREIKDSFLMTKVEDGITAEEHILYTFQDRIAVVTELDECEFITCVNVWMLKESSKSKIFNCDGGGSSSSSDGTQYTYDNSGLTSDDYDILRICAEDECDPDTKDGNRNVVHIPDSDKKEWGSAHYNEAVQGFFMGRQGYLDDLLWPLDEDTPLNECMNQKGLGNATLEITMGALNVILKCHKRKDDMLYFNTCNNRGRAIQTIPASDNGEKRGNKYGDAGVIAPTDQMITFGDIERAGCSSGWCATGDYKRGSNGQIGSSRAGTFAESVWEQREQGQAHGFAQVGNTQ